MKKAKSTRTSKPKANNDAKTVDEYFASIEDPARAMLIKMRETIRSVVPAGTTEVISYRIPAFKQKNIVVWYAGFTNHCSLFPGAAVLRQMKDQLDEFVTSKGTIQFPIDKPLPVALIKKIVKNRLAQLNQKS